MPRTNVRVATTSRYVPKGEAKQRPTTTVTETDRRGGSQSKEGKGRKGL